MVNSKSVFVLAILLSSLSADNFILKDKDCIGYKKLHMDDIAHESSQNSEPQKVIIEDVNPNSDIGKVVSSVLKSPEIKAVLFDYDQHDIRADMSATVESNAEVIKVDAKIKNIKLEGNADERGSDEYNYALALKRANSVKAYYTATGIDGDKISIVSLGEGSPICGEHSEDCWAKNRRVDTKISE